MRSASELRRFSVAITTILALLLIAGPTMAQTTGGVLAGRVLDRRENAVVGATVQITPVDGGSSVTTTTGIDGVFRFDALGVDRYRVIVKAPGWAPVTTTAMVSGADTVQLQLRLELPAVTEEITVTATGTARDTLYVPGELTVVGRESFEKLQARSLDDVLRYEPGVEIGGTRRLLQAPNIRGLDAERVLVLRDGARVSQFTSGHKGSLFLDVEDIERVEVVRGPASALYGSGALGGVLSITTRDPIDMLRPDESVGGWISNNYSSAFNEWTTSPRAFGTTSGNIGYMFGFTARRNDGVVDVGGPINTIESAEEDVNNFDARLILPAGENGTIRTSFNSFSQSGLSAVNLASVVVSPNSQVQRTTDQRTLTVAYEGQGDSWWREDLRASFFYTDMDIEEDRPTDGRLDAIGFRTWGLDARNTVSIGDAQTITYGVEVFEDRERAARDGGASLFFPNGNQTQVGVYLQDEITLADHRLQIVPGVRWDRWNSTTDDPEVQDRNDSRVNLKLGATYEIDRGLVLSANYAEGFRAPNFQELFIGGTHFGFPVGPGLFLQGIFRPNPLLDPETSRNVDLGLRFRRAGFSARVAYYRAWVDDFIAFKSNQSFVPPGTILLSFFAENVQGATLDGVEAALAWNIDRRWSAFANYSRPRGTEDTTGEPLGTIPAAKANIGLQFSEPELGFQVGVNARLVADQNRVPEDVEVTAGYALYDVYTSWTPGGKSNVTFRFGIDNITNKAYQIPFFGTPGTGRDIRAGFTFRFGR